MPPAEQAAGSSDGGADGDDDDALPLHVRASMAEAARVAASMAARGAAVQSACATWQSASVKEIEEHGSDVWAAAREHAVIAARSVAQSAAAEAALASAQQHCSLGVLPLASVVCAERMARQAAKQEATSMGFAAAAAEAECVVVRQARCEAHSIEKLPQVCSSVCLGPADSFCVIAIHVHSVAHCYCIRERSAPAKLAVRKCVSWLAGYGRWQGKCSGCLGSGLPVHQAQVAGVTALLA
jgi:hypothetical protein